MRRIPLTKGAFSIIDDEDYESMSKYAWQLDHGYARAMPYLGKINGKYKYDSLWTHRLIMGTPCHMQTDHINGNRLDNRKVNLRNVTSQQNNQNRHITKARSGVIGVTFKPSSNKWQARVGVGYKRISLGHFNTLEEAVKARENGIKQYFTIFKELKA